jgi:hypothetical protein
MTDYIVTTVPAYVQPTTEITTNEDYVDMVMNMAALSYMAQYSVSTPDEGISAARAAFNASLPPVAL